MVLSPRRKGKGTLSVCCFPPFAHRKDDTVCTGQVCSNHTLPIFDGNRGSENVVHDNAGNNSCSEAYDDSTYLGLYVESVLLGIYRPPKNRQKIMDPSIFFLSRPDLAGVRVKGILKRGFQRKTPKKAPGKEDAMEVVKNVYKIDLLPPPRERTSLNDGRGRENSNITKVEWRKEFFYSRTTAQRSQNPTSWSLSSTNSITCDINRMLLYCIYVVRGALYHAVGNGRYSFPATYCSQFDLFQCVWRLSSWTNYL